MRTGSIILLVLAAHGILLALFVASYPNRSRKANQILALLIFVFSLTVGVPKLVTEFCGTLPHLILVSFPLGFAIGPLLYLYANLLISKMTSPRTLLFHFAPFLLTIAYLLPFYFQSGDDKIAFTQRVAAGSFPKDLLLIWIVKNAHVLTYVLLLYKMLKEHAEKMKRRFSSIETKSLGWLKQLVTGILVVSGINLVFFVSAVLDLFQTPYRTVEFAVGAAMSLLIYSVGFKGLRQPAIFLQTNVNHEDLPSSKYERSGLPREKASDFVSRIIRLMEHEKPYKKPDLTLGDLAAQVRMPANHLSQILNENLKQNFFDFVNDYRVTESKDMMSDPRFRHLTFLAIAYEAGFNSKSAFYRAFKKGAGMTPSKYLQTLHS